MAFLFGREQIEAALPDTRAVLDALAVGFIAYSKGSVSVANVAHLKFDAIPGAPGDACIKAGFIRGDTKKRFVVKLAAGFYNNSARTPPLSNSQGVMLVSSQETGELEAVLADGGLLTDLRTAFAAVLAARTFMQQGSTTAVVVGTGVIATLVAKELAPFLGTDATLLVVSRTPEAAAAFVAARKTEGKYGTVEAVPIEEGIARGDVVVTATPSESPVVTSLRDPATRGQVVVALGSDSVGKRELGPDVVKTAALVVADSKSQCLAFGECASAVKDGVLEPSAITELGEALDDATLRAGPGRSVIVDLTGVAVQDVVIASMTLDALIK